MFEPFNSGYSNLTLEDDGLSYHRIVEAFKFSYAQHSRLGDPAFNKTVNKASQCIGTHTIAHYSIASLELISSCVYRWLSIC